MTPKRTIAVVGATGSQGGGLVRAILDDGGEFTVRALTRNPGSPKGAALSEAGAEVVAADLDDEASLDRAFDGVHGAFVVTNYWAPLAPDAGISRAERELAQAAAAARALERTGVEHVVWSTLEDTRGHFADDAAVPDVEGYKVPHFDAKAEADAFFAGLPVTYLRTTLFFENFVDSFPPRRGDDGALTLALPIADQPLAGIAVDDIGRSALGVFARGDALVGKTVSIAGDILTGDGYAAALSDALGEPVTYVPVPFDRFRAQGFPSAVEMGNMFQYYAENSAQFTADRDLDRVRELNPRLQSFREWLANRQKSPA
ncbi:nucleotide-diphosphate-sugar epimerase [Mycolicibacterium litorale]|uniref:Nucleotide-diphosphate-sugar epimerase n=1 Tax=Mycolicibacterium litorale TaxID=758802 RepID=A0A6S6P1N7_9MYCO|nr:NmrA/HSCARG family protein [Mycolicibacterium litorale]BCI51886.1 nucleotide-diphosphate-sugar epimerase [Mycolicibacterium litorale]